jgi:hypothetical protein
LEGLGERPRRELAFIKSELIQVTGNSKRLQFVNGTTGVILPLKMKERFSRKRSLLLRSIAVLDRNVPTLE